jgi:hypothetical protein
MTEDNTSIVQKPRDYSDLIKLEDPRFLEDFLDQPLTFIADTINGALGVGTKGVFASGGRIVHALLKGRLLTQWSHEFKSLRDAGRLEEDFADTKYGFQTWVELMSIIDEGTPDADRLEALKAAFYAVNKVKAEDAERIQAYQLWRLAKEMNSGDLLVLKVIYDQMNRTPNGNWGVWMAHIAKESGLGFQELLERHEKRLLDFSLLTPRFRVAGDGVGIESGIQIRDNRLTQVGVRFCQNIQTYTIDLGAAKKAKAQ